MGRVSEGIILPKDICLAYALAVGDIVVLEVQPRMILLNFKAGVEKQVTNCT